jgi:hypothetical protein
VEQALALPAQRLVAAAGQVLVADQARYLAVEARAGGGDARFPVFALHHGDEVVAADVAREIAVPGGSRRRRCRP